MIQVYHTFNLGFKDNASIFSAASNVVLPAETATDIQSKEDIEKEMYQSFVDERIKGRVSIWSTMKKRNLKHSRCKEKALRQRFEHTLPSHFLITAGKRPELDLEGTIENYKFAVVPQSIFTSDGQLLHSFDKAKVLHAIESMVKDEETNADETNLDASIRVIINDGMAQAKKVHKDKNMKTGKVILAEYLVEPH